MRTCWVSIAIAAFALMIPALVPADAFAQLGTSPWSLEIGTTVGTSGDFAFGVRRHSGATSALRLLAEVNTNDVDGEGTLTDTGNPDLDAEQDAHFHSLGLFVHWMRFAKIRDGLSATFAVGPGVRSVGFSFRQGTGQGTASFAESESSQQTLTFGLDLLLGAEWFFNPRFSLGGSAGFRGEIGSGDQDQIFRSGTGATYSITQVHLDRDVKQVSTRSGRIQLAVYF